MTRNNSTPPTFADPSEEESEIIHPTAINEDIPAVANEKSLRSTTNSAGEPLQKPDTNDEVYSIFSTRQKKFIVLAASFCSFLSPLSGSIYYPSLTTIANDHHTSSTAINLTVTSYLIVQGIAPTFTAGLSDSAGRRPAYFFCFIGYIAANIGLGAQRSYVALLVLRMVQSAGSSGTVALATGVAADLVSAAERGSYVSLASLGAWLGPMLGPFLSGLIGEFLDWHWIFWFLATFSGAVFVLTMLFFPETNRKIVGNGLYEAPLPCRSLLGDLMARERKRRGIMVDQEKQQRFHESYRWKFPNPFATVLMAWDKACLIILIGNGLVVGNMYAIPVGVSELFSVTYGYNQIQIALCFLPFGAGAILATFIFGGALDKSYRKHAVRLSLPTVRNRRQDVGDFPIERARFEVGLPALFLGMAFIIAYGWVLEAKTHVSGPLILSFIISLTTTGAYQVVNTLMIDNFPDQAATATAANNLFRCLVGAGATAAIAPMFSAWGAGWTYTFFALLWVVYCPFTFLLLRKGKEWRSERKARNATERQDRNL